MKKSIALGIDIGGSHITAALVNIKEGVVLEDTYVRKRVDSHGTAIDIITIWKDVIKEVFNKRSVSDKKIGIAMPGPFDYENGISLIKGVDKYESLYGLNLRQLLSNALDITTDNIQFRNDAACFLQGEVAYGAAKSFESSVGITLGTGAGSATFFNGIVEEGNLWQMPFKDTTAEEYLSTRWFIKRYYELSGKLIKDVKILSELVPDNAEASQVFKEFGYNLGEAIYEFTKGINPSAVVIGGNICQAWDLFISETKELLTSKNNEVLLTKAALGESAALLGAVTFYKNILMEA